MPADGRRRRVEQRGDFRNGESVHLKELDDEPPARRQCIEALPERRVDLRALRRLGWRRTGVGDLLAEIVRAPDGSCRGEIETAIHDDARQPGPERTSCVERVDVLERRQKGILHEIFGVFAVVQDAQRQRDRAREMILDERAECVPVPVPNTKQELVLAFAAGVRGQVKRP